MGFDSKPQSHTPHAAGGAAATADTPEPQTGPQPKTETPLEQPVIYYNLKWRVPPLVVKTQEQQDALDPDEWTQDPGHVPVTSADDAKKQWPKLYYDVNIPLKTVGTPEEAAALDSRWRPLDISEGIIKAAQAKLDADKAAADKKADKAAKPTKK